MTEAVRRSVDALENGDKQLAYQTILNDNPVNRAVEDCDRACHQFVARHLPAAGHLRFISSVMRLNIVLERVGDYAATICRVAVQLDEKVGASMLDRIKSISGGSTAMLEQAIGAFISGDPDQAKGTIALEAQIDESFQSAINHALESGESEALSRADLYGNLVILSTLERVSDQAKNICEYAIFAETGETKQRKPARVLFVDRDSSLLGPMAVAIARKGFSSHGDYSTAGLSVVSSLDAEFASKMASLGHDITNIQRKTVESVLPDLKSIKVVVVLEGDPNDYLESVPFNTTVVRWNLPAKSGPFEALYKAVAAAIGDLMITLRGDQPDEL